MAEEQKPLPWVEQALRTLATTIHRGTYNHGIPLQPESIATTIECLLPNAQENWQERDLEADINDPEDGPAMAKRWKARNSTTDPHIICSNRSNDHYDHETCKIEVTSHDTAIGRSKGCQTLAPFYRQKQSHDGGERAAHNLQTQIHRQFTRHAQRKRNKTVTQFGWTPGRGATGRGTCLGHRP